MKQKIKILLGLTYYGLRVKLNLGSKKAIEKCKKEQDILETRLRNLIIYEAGSYIGHTLCDITRNEAEKYLTTENIQGV